MFERWCLSSSKQLPGFPPAVSLELGQAVKTLRLRMGMTQDELAQSAGLSPSALKTFENGYAKFTKLKHLNAMTKVLGTSLEVLLLESREWFPANFFVTRTQGILVQPKPPKRREAPVENPAWPQTTLSEPGIQITFFSPPIPDVSHFQFVRIRFAPAGKLSSLSLRLGESAFALITQGSIQIRREGHPSLEFFANQGFGASGPISFDLANTDASHPAECFMTFRLRPIKNALESKKSPPGKVFSIGHAVRTLRSHLGEKRGQTLSVADFSGETGLDPHTLRYLENTVRENSVVYWNKIERILRTTRTSVGEFIEYMGGNPGGRIEGIGSQDRSQIDYRHAHGIRIRTAVAPHAQRIFSFAEFTAEPRGEIRRIPLKRRDPVMMAFFVAAGELLIEVGKNRKALLHTGDAVYFDASLGYTITNPGEAPGHWIAAASPALTF
ncbi:MAG: helix-turn-helix domain-containing protein [Candidatus Omnitrophota bacterium]